MVNERAPETRGQTLERLTAEYGLRWIKPVGNKRIDVLVRIDDAWDALGVLRAVDGSPVLAEVTVRPREGTEAPAGGVPARVLRAVRLDAFRAAAAEHPMTSEVILRFASSFDDASLRRPAGKPGRKGLPDRFYAEVAARYVHLVDHEGDRSPARTMARELEVPVRTIHTYLYEARERRLLRSIGAGRAGGKLTELGRAALDEPSGEESR